MRKQKSREDPAPEADSLTPRERGVLSLMREGLNDEQIAERLGINVATAQYDVWGILSKLGLESRAQVAVARPQPSPTQEPEPTPEPAAVEPEATAAEPEPRARTRARAGGAGTRAGARTRARAGGRNPSWSSELEPEPEPEVELRPEPVPFDPEPDGTVVSTPEPPRRRINLRLAAQVFGIGLALAGLGLVVWGGVRMASDDTSDRPVVRRTALPSLATAGVTNPPSTITPFPTVAPEDAVAFGQFGFRRALYSVRPDVSEPEIVLPSLPRAYALSPDGTQLAYVQSYGDTDLKVISATGEALFSLQLEGVFNVDGLTWPGDGSRIVLSVQVAQPSDPSTLKDTIALLDLEATPLPSSIRPRCCQTGSSLCPANRPRPSPTPTPAPSSRPTAPTSPGRVATGRSGSRP